MLLFFLFLLELIWEVMGGEYLGGELKGGGGTYHEPRILYLVAIDYESRAVRGLPKPLTSSRL